MRLKIINSIVLILCLILCSFSVASAHGDHVTIVILKSDELKSTARTISGAKKVISSSIENTDFTEFLYFGSITNDSILVDSINVAHPRLILTIGSLATKFAKEKLGKYPVVFAAVMYPKNSGFVNSLARPGNNITGASLNIPVDVQFRYYRTIIPDLKNIGVLYTKKTKPLIDAATIKAREMGINLISYRIDHNRELPKALDSLAKVVDGLWSVADEELFSPQSTKYILLNTVRKQIPFMGFSRHIVESGALFALDFNYKAVGRQAGEIAVRVLEGEKVGEIPVSQVNMLWFHYNEKTAKRINLVIPGELISVAKEVYR